MNDPAHPVPDERSAQPDAEVDARQLAAVDLGSNSFHLAIARVRGDEIAMLDRVRDQVQLAKGLGKRKRLTKKASERALRCLERFSQRLRHVPSERVRAVATSTLRSARDSAEFMERAVKALGHPIEIIAGREEARLIYLGVAHSLADEPGPRLVVDIGGGSTELILGERFEALEVHSLNMGCVHMTKRFFADGAITPRAMEKAQLHAARELQTIERGFRESGWTQAAGASGTVRTIGGILNANGWSDNGIRPGGLKKLRKAVLAAKHTSRLKLRGLKSARAPVFPGGLAIFLALFERLDVGHMAVSPGALREGVMYDLLGRIRHEDVRERTIKSFQSRYRVDLAQAARVERTVLALLSHMPEDWSLDPAEDGRVLAWAARLHEIGLAVSWSRHHRHGGYLIQHADMPGFSKDDQELLAAVVACHRRKIDPQVLEQLPDARWERAVQLLVLLRLAVLLHRGRSPDALPPFRLTGEGARVRLCGPRRWLDENALSVLDLGSERGHLKALGIDFAVD